MASIIPLDKLLMKQLWMGLQMTDKEIITNIKDLKEYLKYLLNNEIRHREKERGIGVFLAENIQRYDFQCAEILLLQRLLKKLGVKVENYNPYETDEDDDRYNYWGSAGPIGVKDD